MRNIVDSTLPQNAQCSSQMFKLFLTNVFSNTCTLYGLTNTDIGCPQQNMTDSFLPDHPTLKPTEGALSCTNIFQSAFSVSLGNVSRLTTSGHLRMCKIRNQKHAEKGTKQQQCSEQNKTKTSQKYYDQYAQQQQIL